MSDERAPRMRGRLFGVKLCEALGLDVANVRSITLHCDVDSAVTIDTESYVRSDAGDKVLVELKKYNLVGSGAPLETTVFGSENKTYVSPDPEVDDA